MRKFLKAFRLLGVIIAVLLVCAVAAFFVLSRDIPPTDVSDLISPEPPQVAPEDNAFTYFMQAEELISKHYEPDVLEKFLAGNACDTNELIKVLAGNEAMIEKIQEGLLKKVCVIPEEVSRTVCFTPHIREWMHIRMVLLARSKYQLVTDQYSDALDTCLTNLRFVSLLRRSINDEILFIVCNGMARSALLQSAHIARSGGLSEDQLAGLSEAFKDFDGTEEDWVRVLKYEYHKDVDFFSGGFLEDYLNHVCGYETEVFSDFKLQPNMVKDQLAVFCREMIRNVQVDYSKLKFISGEQLLDSVKYNPWNLSVILIHKAEYRKYKSKAWMCRVESLSLFRFCLSVTRLVVALNRYEMRNGKLPERLEQLVPEYIDSVPRDPYDGKPFRYDRNKEIVYSVGKNLKDEGGSIERAYRGKKLQASSRFKAEDYVFGIKKDPFQPSGKNVASRASHQGV